LLLECDRRILFTYQHTLYQKSSWYSKVKGIRVFLLPNVTYCYWSQIMVRGK
jgi:hypothetical protein